MKKLLSLTLAIIFCLSAFIPVFADVAGPVFMKVDCVVNDEDGATVYYREYNETTEESHWKTEIIPNGTALKATEMNYSPFSEDDVEYAEKFKDVAFVSVDYKEDEQCYMERSELILKNESYPLTDASKIKNPEQFRVAVPKGLDMFAGPSSVYAKVGHIPFGTDVTFYYDDGEGSERGYAYTSYNGVDGWICAARYENELAWVLDDNSFYTGKLTIVNTGAKLYSFTDDGAYGQDAETNEDNKGKSYAVTDEIPVGTELTFDCYINGIKTLYAHTSYKGTQGWIAFSTDYDERHCCYAEERDVGYLLCDATIYKTLGDYDSKTEEVIPAATVVTITGTYNDGAFENENSSDDDEYEDSVYRHWYIIDYNGKEVYLTNEKGKSLVSSSWAVTYKTKEAATVYESDSESSNPVYTIAQGETFTGYFSHCIKGTTRADYFEDDNLPEWYYTFKDGKCGWVSSESIDSDYTSYDSDTAYLQPRSLTLEKNGEIVVGEYPTIKDADSDADIATTETVTVDNSTDNTAVYCAIGAAILALTAIVIIIIIKKRKKAPAESGNNDSGTDNNSDNNNSTE